MIKEIGANDWEKEVMAQGEKPIVVEFVGSHCVWCKRLEPVYERLSKEYTAVTMLNIVIDKDEDNIRLALKYGIDSTPTIKIFYKGVVIGELVGYAELEFLKAEIEHVIRRKDSITGRSSRSGTAETISRKDESAQERQNGEQFTHIDLMQFVGAGTHTSGDDRLPDKEEPDEEHGADEKEPQEGDDLDIENIEKP